MPRQNCVAVWIEELASTRQLDNADPTYLRQHLMFSCGTQRHLVKSSITWPNPTKKGLTRAWVLRYEEPDQGRR